MAKHILDARPWRIKWRKRKRIRKCFCCNLILGSVYLNDKAWFFSHTSNANFSSSIYRRLLQKYWCLQQHVIKIWKYKFLHLWTQSLKEKMFALNLDVSFWQATLKFYIFSQYAWSSKALSGNSTKFRIAYEQFYKKNKN